LQVVLNPFGRKLQPQELLELLEHIGPWACWPGSS